MQDDELHFFLNTIFKDSDGQPPMTQMLSMDQKKPQMFRRFKWPRVCTLLGIGPPSEVVIFFHWESKVAMEDKDPPF